jgi:hypothetical protein
MKKQQGITLVLALGLLSSSAAMADDAILGALLGGGAGAVVGHSIGGRDGTIIGGAIGAAAGAAIGSQQRSRVEYVAPPVYYAAPAYPQQAYYPQQQVYYAQPVYQRPSYYVERGYERDYHRHHEHRDWNRDDRGWDGRR